MFRVSPSPASAPCIKNRSGLDEGKMWEGEYERYAESMMTDGGKVK
jgi:hypothetical protein